MQQGGCVLCCASKRANLGGHEKIAEEISNVVGASGQDYVET